MPIYDYDPTGWRMWGLLRRTSEADSPWVPVKMTNNIFDTEREALRQANEWNAEYGNHYLYKVVSLRVVILEGEREFDLAQVRVYGKTVLE